MVNELGHACRPIMAENRAGKTKKRRLPGGKRRFFSIMTRREEFFVLGRPGSDLLSQGLSHSTIGAEEFNGRVRDGIGFKLLARTTRPAKDKETKQARMRSIRAQSSGLTRGPTLEAKHWSLFRWIAGSSSAKTRFALLPGNDKETMDTENESNQANRTISTGKLH